MSPVFDHFGSLKRMGNDEQLLREMVGFFQEDAPYWLREVRAGLQETDLPRIERAAHSLKGLASNFGAVRAMQAAASLEEQARSRDAELLPALASELQKALHELLTALAPLAGPTAKASP